MADTYTPGLGLTLPEVGASRDTWGTKCNSNFSTIDEFLTMAAPIGMIIDFAGPQAPPGYLICDGRAISRVTYSALFAVIGTWWGQGDGSTTFNLPPTMGRAAIGPGTIIDQNGNQQAFTFAQNAGALSGQIAQAHLPNYAMGTDTQGWHSHGGATALGGSHSHSLDYQGNHSHGGSTSGVGNHVHAGSTVSLYDFGQMQAGSAAYQAVMAGFAGGRNFPLSMTADGAHNHSISTDVQGNHTHNVSASGNFQLGINGDGNHAHTVWLGGGAGWFGVLQPVMVVTKIIYAGQQAAARFTALAATTQRRIAAPMRGSH